MNAALRLVQYEKDSGALIDSFIGWRPEGTRRVYRGELLTFLRWTAMEPHQISSGDLRRYIESCRKRGLKPSTIHRKITIIKSFYSFLYREGDLRSNPVDLVETPPCPPPGKPKGITKEQARAFFAAASGHSLTAYRDRACYLLMASTGLRVSEIRNLSVSDVGEADEKDWKTLRIVGKGQKEREVHIRPAVWGTVLAYIQRRKEPLDDSSPLFASVRRGSPIQPMAPDRRLSCTGIYERFVKLAKKAGLPDGASPHSLRHFFACEADAAGASVEAIRLALGHAGLGTTQKYLVRVRRGVNEAFAKAKVP